MMHRGFCIVLTNLLFLLVFAFGCKTAPEVISGRQAVENKQYKEGHEFYRQAIIKYPNYHLAYSEYVEWLPASIQHKAEKIQYASGELHEVTSILKLRNGFMDLLDSISETEEFLVNHFNPNIAEFKKALAKFRISAAAKRQLLNHHIDKLESNAMQLKKQVALAMSRGESAYRMGQLEMADRYLNSALSKDASNKRSREILNNINDIDCARSLMLQKHLSQSRQILNGLIKNNPNDLVIKKLSRMQLATLLRVSATSKNYRKLGEIAGKRKKFANAATYFRKAIAANLDLEIELVSSIKAMDHFQLGFNAMKNKKYGLAINHYKDGLDLWPEFVAAKKWMKNADYKHREFQVKEKLKMAEAAFLSENADYGNKLILECEKLTSNKKKIRKAINKIYLKVRKKFVKLSKQAGKDNDVVKQLHYLNVCVDSTEDRICKKEISTLSAKLVAEAEPVAIAGAEQKNWLDALIASGLVLELDPSREETKAIFETAKKQAEKHSTLILHATNGSDNLLFKSLTETFTVNSVRWRWATAGEDGTTAGKHLKLVQVESARPESETGKPAAQLVQKAGENKDKNDPQLIMENGYLLTISDFQDRQLAWSWNSKPELSNESAKQLALALIEHFSTNHSDHTSTLNLQVFRKYLYNPPATEKNWLELYFMLPTH